MFPHQQLDKASTRRNLRAARAAITPEQRLAAAWAVTRSPQILRRLRHGQKIAIYVPVAGEFPTWPLILHAMQRGCEVYLPRTPRFGRQLQFVRLDQQSRWQLGKFGIPVPCHPQTCDPKQLDTVFVPLVGFDLQMARLGQGGGYYDTTFAFRRLRRLWQKPKLIGLAFSVQQLANIPTEPWDLHLDAVQTECKYLQAAVDQITN
ncbi:5-formyltetrahydrofolate cyclo-ligase [Chitinibacter fontanus]|uniref:5-formyltetrahydrofolate cyclo-ligase n=1 Tax=Chitinibacter fontanus TaxID=1737446 RepID=A0A7D5V9G7_9NEIS|nr:5-formyltetrahydrofolate cyclo-ligase [Chitinibacter fontanus]QLI81431.1 5-formyltetrahydrofolate cyclo-ligase [Chitinibacter fontanus]